MIEAVRGSVDTGGTLRPGGDLMAVLRSRLEQSTAAAQEVACLASAVGADFTLDLLTEASDLDADVVVRGGRRAVAPPDRARAARGLRLLP